MIGARRTQRSRAARHRASAGPGGRGDPPERRNRVAAASAANVLVGLWLVVAPFALGYGIGDPIWNDVVAGAAVAIIALLRVMTGLALPALAWVNAAIGLWLFASAFWLDVSARAAWNDLASGSVIVLLAAASLTASSSAGPDAG